MLNSGPFLKILGNSLFSSARDNNHLKDSRLSLENFLKRPKVIFCLFYLIIDNEICILKTFYWYVILQLIENVKKKKKNCL